MSINVESSNEYNYLFTQYLYNLIIRLIIINVKIKISQTYKKLFNIVLLKYNSFWIVKYNDCNYFYDFISVYTNETIKFERLNGGYLLLISS